MFTLIPEVLSEEGNIQNNWATCKNEATTIGVQEGDETCTELGKIDLGFNQTQLRFFLHFLPNPMCDSQKWYYSIVSGSHGISSLRI